MCAGISVIPPLPPPHTHSQGRPTGRGTVVKTTARAPSPPQQPVQACTSFCCEYLARVSSP